jgi:excisionase family DNA binding protein
MPIEKLYELSEAAEITGLKLGTVRQFVSRGIIEARYLGRKRVIPASVLERICTEGLRIPKRTSGNAGKQG